MDSEKARREIEQLIAKYRKVVEDGRVKGYKEEETKKDFIQPLFRTLGWDMENSLEVSAEENVSKRRVDYGFRINGIPKFFLEAKSLREDVEDPEYIRQAINYAWHKSCTWAVLTNFKTLRIFNAEIKNPNPLQSELITIHYENYLDRFEDLLLLSKEGFNQGLLDQKAEKWGKKLRKSPITEQLLADFTRFRELLSKNIIKLNQSRNLSEEDLDEAVQRILDRLIFIRNCEDRELEHKVLQPNLRAWEDKGRGQLIKSLRQVFNEYDQRYNSKLFTVHLCDSMEIDNEVLSEIISGLYQTKDLAISYDFSQIEADVLGNIYEQYLGHILRKTDKRAKLKEDHAHRKEQGIYYTPTYIVDYIVKNTLGELLKDPNTDYKKIKVLDPACGSGSFLIRAYDLLYENYKKKTDAYTEVKKDEILKNNIYGVDLDKQAVEIAQLNLLLKIAEKGHKLPLLQENIKNGNSLIDDPTVAGDKAFKWAEQFPEIMKNGGFDVVIGNPPYINNRNLPAKDKTLFEKKYSTAQQQYDIYVLFYELALSLVKPGGYVGFITPNKFAITNYGTPLRKIMIANKIVKVVDVSQLNVFGDASTYPYIVILQKLEYKDNNIEFYSPQSTNLGSMKYIKIAQNSLKPEESFLFNQSQEERSILNKISGEFILDVYRAKPTSKSISDRGDVFVLSNREIERYNILPASKKIAKKKEWLVDTPAILMKKICFTPTSSLFESAERIPINTVYVIHSKNNEVSLRYLLAILNSKLFGYYTRKKYATTAMRGGFIELRAFEIEQLPIKIVSDSEQKPIISLVDKMLSLNKRLSELGDKKTDERACVEEEIRKTDAEIDSLVYRIYSLTDEEIRVVESALKP